VADAWLPEARRIPAKLDGGPLKGGAPRAVWFTSESDPKTVSSRSVAETLIREGRPAHLVWNPFEGEIFQLIAVTLAARLLPGDLGREGRVCVQIMVVGRLRAPFTDSPLKGLSELMSWLDSWGVPRRWPAGPPMQAPQSYQAVRERRTWARGGHFGHSQVPEEVGADPPARRRRWRRSRDHGSHLPDRSWCRRPGGSPGRWRRCPGQFPNQ
jgi:hypothetical protein